MSQGYETKALDLCIALSFNYECFVLVVDSPYVLELTLFMGELPPGTERVPCMVHQSSDDPNRTYVGPFELNLHVRLSITPGSG